MIEALRHTPVAVDYGSLGILQDSRIIPIDSDGIVYVEHAGTGMLERRGHFLFLELKQPGEKVSGGQLRLLEALAREDNKTVLIVWLSGERSDRTGAFLFQPTAYRKVGRDKDPRPTTLEQFTASYKQWFDECTHRGHR